MSFNDYYTISEISKKLNVPETLTHELCIEYGIFLKRVSDENQIKYHPNCLGMFRYIMNQSEKGLDHKEIKKSLGFNPAVICNKDKTLCQ